MHQRWPSHIWSWMSLGALPNGDEGVATLGKYVIGMPNVDKRSACMKVKTAQIGERCNKMMKATD